MPIGSCRSKFSAYGLEKKKKKELTAFSCLDYLIFLCPWDYLMKLSGYQYLSTRSIFARGLPLSSLSFNEMAE